MPTIDVKAACPVFDSFRVRQVSGMFDLPPSKSVVERFAVETPDGFPHADDWRIGLIVGPSGSGKSTIARAIFGDRVYQPRRWPADRAVIDGFGELPTKQITKMLTAVGFSSPPSWLKPYRVLSGGEQFRCDLARALLGTGDLGRGVGDWTAENDEHDSDSDTAGQASSGTRASYFQSSLPRPESPALRPQSPAPRLPPPAPAVVFDEFTSVVDRNVARIVSAAIAKGIRAGWIGRRLVAVACHYDVTDWLAPDWVIDMATGEYSRRRLRRPPIELRLFRCRRSAWRLFARHHYLSGELPRFARCFLATCDGRPAAFCAMLNLIGRKNRWRVSRIVTLPDYQGVGIGTAVVEAVAELHRREGNRVNVTTSHPAMIAHCSRSPRWRAVNVRKSGAPRPAWPAKNYRGSPGRAVVSFEFLGEN